MYVREFENKKKNKNETGKRKKEKEERVRAASRCSGKVQVDEPVEAVSGTYIRPPIFMGQKEREKKKTFSYSFFIVRKMILFLFCIMVFRHHSHHQSSSAAPRLSGALNVNVWAAGRKEKERAVKTPHLPVPGRSYGIGWRKREQSGAARRSLRATHANKSKNKPIEKRKQHSHPWTTTAQNVHNPSVLTYIRLRSIYMENNKRVEGYRGGFYTPGTNVRVCLLLLLLLLYIQHKGRTKGEKTRPALDIYSEQHSSKTNKPDYSTTCAAVAVCCAPRTLLIYNILI